MTLRKCSYLLFVVLLTIGLTPQVAFADVATEVPSTGSSSDLTISPSSSPSTGSNVLGQPTPPGGGGPGGTGGTGGTAPTAPATGCTPGSAVPTCTPGVGAVPPSSVGGATAPAGAVPATAPVSPAPGTSGAAGVGTATNPLGSFGQSFMDAINNAATEAAVGREGQAGDVGLIGFVINDLLGPDSPEWNPLISCNDLNSTNPAAGADCKPWFINQYSMMRQFGVYMVVPLMMLVIIQSVLRGSLFMLLRASLILLPTAIIGSVVVAGLAQLLLNISDDFATAMFSLSGTNNFDDLRTGIKSMSDNGITFFGLLFLLVTLIAALIIMIEMILREVGVYLTVLFMPLCFAGLVWPASSRWAKRLLELLVGLIFSKVFIAAGMALGLSAIKASTADPGQVGFMPAVQASAIFVMAGIFGIRMMAWTPGGDGATGGRALNPSGVLGMGEFTSNRLQANRDRINGAIGRAATPTGRGFNN